MKKQKGITLIALVITIIVLLILAGVALATLTGNNNIIENANEAVGKYNNSVNDEKATMGDIENLFEKYVTEEKTPPVSAGEIANNASKYYGGYVTNYTTPSGDPNVKWRIFHADESNIYLISDDYIHYDYCPVGAKGTSLTRNTDYRSSFDNVYKDYTGAESIKDNSIAKKWMSKYLTQTTTSTDINIRAVAFMLDEARWSAKYANPSYAKYAIGGPTLELFAASYNKTHQEKPMYCSANSTGYYISWTDGGTTNSISGLDTSNSLYVISDDLKSWGMWLVSPSAFSAMIRVKSNGNIDVNDIYSTAGFRPIVCLNTGIQLEKQSDGNYKIVTNTEGSESADKNSGGTTSDN